jgi:hypothetical protein
MYGLIAIPISMVSKANEAMLRRPMAAGADQNIGERLE